MQTSQIMNPLDVFLARYPKSTKETYRGALKGYFKLLETNPETYFTDNRDCNADILYYAQSIKDKFAPKTYSVYISCIRKFLQRNRVPLDVNTIEDLSMIQRIREPITRDRIPTEKELKDILSHGNLKDKAVFLTLVSSGMRVGEATKFTVHDIFIDEKPVRIELEARYCKNKQSRTVFISNEASGYMEKWLKQREAWLISVSKRHISKKYGKSANDDRVFPVSRSAIRIRWNKLLDKVELGARDRNTGYREIHLHCLRKYYRTHMANSCSRDVVETLMGHAGYLTNSYVRLTKEDLAKEYKSAMDCVTVFESSNKGDLEKLEAEIKRRDEKLEEIEQRTEFLKNLDKKDLQKLIAMLKGKPLD